MKRMRKVVSTLLLVCVLASILAVSASAEGILPGPDSLIIPDGTSIKIDSFSQTPFTIPSNGTHTVELKLSADDYSDYKVYWKVDGNTVSEKPAAEKMTLTLNGGDYATAGSHNLTVEVYNKDSLNVVASATVIFTVTAMPQSITFDEAVINLDSFNTYKVNNARILPSEADQSVTWESSNTGVAVVGMDGTVHGVANGSAQIWATSVANPSLRNYYTVNVSVPTAAISFQINKEYVNLEVDGKENVNVVLTPDEGKGNSVTWESSDTTVCTVGKSEAYPGDARYATITAVGSGSAIVRAYTTDGSALSDECFVVVSGKDEAAKLTISPIKANLVPGESVKLSASVVGTDYVSTWYSSDPNSVKLSTNGNSCTVTALKVSSEPVEIHAITKFNKMEATALIYIGESEILELATSATTVKSGDSVSVSVNNARNNETFTWSFTPNDGTIVKSSYTKNNALIMSIGDGEGTITVNCVSNMDATRKATATIGANGVDPFGTAYISPKSVNWTYGSGDLSFQVMPAIYWAYLDNQYLNTKSTSLAQYWNGTLTLKAAYLNTLSNGTHTLKIYTAYDENNNPTGLVYANIYISGNGTGTGAGAAYGDNAHVKGSASNLYFNSSTTIDDVYISGKWIDPANYSLSTDGKTITLNSSFLNQLAYGSYTMQLTNDAGSTQTTNFRIVTANYAPSTGDEAQLGLWITVMVLSGAGVVALIPRKKNSLQ